jgi:hypothetical protein
MRGAGFFLTITLVSSVAAFAGGDEVLAGLVKRAEAASIGQQPALYAEIAERQLREADQLYNNGKVDAARAAVDDVVTYSDRASDAASHARSKIKNTEIAIRKMAAKLRDIRRGLAFEDQPPVQAAADHLEALRSGLLSRMFAKDH